MLKPTYTKRVIFFVVSDLMLSLISLYASYALRFNFAVPERFLETFMYLFAAIAVCRIVSYAAFRLYSRSWRYFGLQDLRRLLVAHLLGSSVFAALFIFSGDLLSPVPRSALVIDFALSIVLIGGFRISRRLFLESSDRSGKECIVIGATPRGAQIIKSSLLGEISYHPVAVMDDRQSVVGTYMENLKVFDERRLKEIIEKRAVKAALIAKNLMPAELDLLFERLREYGIEDIKIVNLVSDRKESLKDIAIEDILARKPKDLDLDAIGRFIKNKKILITGAGGSIGSEICRQCLKFGAAKLILVEHSEYNLYAIHDELDSPIVVPKLLSVLDMEKLERVFGEFVPDIVIHAAAYKHVPLCEFNSEAAIENNIRGAMNVMDLSVKYGAEKVVNISSDKAVRPTNIMGATKRVTELYAQNMESGDTEIVSVRFGNVLGSSGSVVPKFKSQIENGGPVTVTHPEITRYFMLIPEACQLVLQAAAMAKGGELFILDMGEPVKIADMAKKMIRLYGRENEIEIEFTGLRPGEKLYEELLLDESERKTRYESILIARPTPYDLLSLKRDIEELFAAEDKIDRLRMIVPEFRHRR